jgi:2-polyprenyl-3-methyl-5-hydroxy-6-metoxy-1,4-benzoquinol methylase
LVKLVSLMGKRRKNEIVEKTLGIPPDYQYKALRSRNIFQRNWHRNKWLVIEKYARLNPNLRVLDLGAGSGNFELEFADKVKEIVALDYNDEAIGFLRKQLKQEDINNVEVVLMDIRDNKITELGKFDLVVMVDVIEHIKISDSEKLVEKIAKILKPGGVVCVVTPNYHSSWIVIEKLLDKITIVPKFDGEQHLAKYYRNNLINLFEKSNYKIESISSFNLFSYIYPFPLFSRLVLKLELLIPVILGNLLVGTFRLSKNDSRKNK